MRWYLSNDNDVSLDKQIERVLTDMSMVEVTSEEYKTMMKHLKHLNELKTKRRRKPISSDTILIVVGNLLGIAIVVLAEDKHILSAQGMREIIRPRTP